jgi:hypothetical protein
MFAAKQGKEIVLKLKNEIGLLSEIGKLLAEKGVSILAVSATVCGEDGVLRLVTDDNLRTGDALAEQGYTPHEEDVILLEVPHKPGMLKRMAEVLAGENIDILNVYATALDEQEKCLLVLHTSGDEHALPKLNKMRGNE